MHEQVMHEQVVHEQVMPGAPSASAWARRAGSPLAPVKSPCWAAARGWVMTTDAVGERADDGTGAVTPLIRHQLGDALQGLGPLLPPRNADPAPTTAGPRRQQRCHISVQPCGFLFRCLLHGAQTGTFFHAYPTTCVGAPTITPL